MCSVVTTVPSACKSQSATVAPTRYTNDRAPYRPRSHVQAGAADRKRSHAGTPRAGVEGQRLPTLPTLANPTDTAGPLTAFGSARNACF